MSKQIDEKVVEMQFNNRQFEKAASQSMDTLSRLKKSLDLKDAAKGFAELDDAARKVDFSVFASSIDTIGKRFSALEVIGITALSNITNSAINAGERLVKSLSFDQIASGFTKYDQKTSSVQTIMNATGKTIDEVNESLAKLMWFSDETSYGFTDMTAALGQMTAAGADVEKVIPLITGVANSVAYAGKGAAEFSRVMYNLNQSYSSGNLQYQDWRSIELAGAASKELKQALIDAGIAMGTLSKEGKLANGELVTIANFGTTLKSKWANTEVMEEAFGRFAQMSDAAYEMVKNGEVDTASQAIERLTGKYGDLAEKAFKSAQEAKSFSEAIEATKDAVSSGFMESFDIIFGNYVEAKELWTDLANTLWDIFASGAEGRNDLLRGWKELGGRTALIEALFTTLDNVQDVLSTVRKGFETVFPPITAEKLADVSERIQQLTESFQMSQITMARVRTALIHVFAVFKDWTKVIGAIKNGFSDVFSPITTEHLYSFLTAIQNLADKFRLSDRTIQGIRKTSAGFFSLIKFGLRIVVSLANAFSSFLDVLSPVSESFFSLTGAVGEYISSAEKAASKSELIRKAFEKLGTGIQFVSTGFVKVLSVIRGGFSKLFSGEMSFDPLIQGLSKVVTFFKTEFAGININNILDAALSGGLAGLVLSVKSLVDKLRKFTGRSGLGGIFEEVRDSINAFQHSIDAKVLKEIAVSMAILAGAMFALTLINPDNLAPALGAITGLFIELMASLEAFKVISNGKGLKSINKITSSLIKLSVSVLILAAAAKVLGNMDWEDVAQGLVGVSGLITGLVVGMKSLSKIQGSLLKSSMAIAAFAIGIRILSGAVKSLGEMDTFAAVQGVASLATVLVGLLAVLKFADIGSIGFSSAAGLLVIAIGVRTLAKAIVDLGNLDYDRMAVGFMVISALLAEVSAFAFLLGQSNILVKTAISFGVISLSMNLLAKAIERIGMLDPLTMVKGMIGIAAALGILGAAVKLIPKESMIGTGVGLILVASSLNILSAAVSSFGGMGVEQMVQGLFGLAGALVAVSLATMAMQGAIAGAAAMLVVGAALAIMVPSIVALSVVPLDTLIPSLMTLAVALTAFGLIGTMLAPSSVAILAFSGSLLALSVSCAGVAGSLLVFALAMKMLMSAFSGMDVNMVDIIKLLGTLVAAFALVIPMTVPLLAASGALAAFSLACIALGAGLTVMSVGFGLISAAEPKGEKALRDLSSLLETIPSDIFKTFTADLIKFATAMKSSSDSIYAVSRACKDAMLKGFEGSDKDLAIIVTTMLSKSLNLIKYQRSSWQVSGGYLVEGFALGIESKSSAAINAAARMAKEALRAVNKELGINSPSKEFEKSGLYSNEGYAKGLLKNVDLVESAATKLGDAALSPIRDASSNIMSKNGAMAQALNRMSGSHVSVIPDIYTEDNVTVEHKFEVLRVEGVNDRGEFVAAADYAVEEMLANIMRRQNRL